MLLKKKEKIPTNAKVLFVFTKLKMKIKLYLMSTFLICRCFHNSFLANGDLFFPSLPLLHFSPLHTSNSQSCCFGDAFLNLLSSLSLYSSSIIPSFCQALMNNLFLFLLININLFFNTEFFFYSPSTHSFVALSWERSLKQLLRKPEESKFVT